MTEYPRLPIVIVAVSYESDDSAVELVRNVTTLAEGEYVRVVVVDNTEGGESRGFFERLTRVNPDVLCVKPPSNLGYFGGARRGFQEYLRTGMGYEWVIVSNVDVLFESAEFLVNLRRMENLEDVGVVAPSIWSSKAWRDQNPKMVYRPSRRKLQFLRVVYQRPTLMNLYGFASLLKHNLAHVLLKPLLDGRHRHRELKTDARVSKATNELTLIYAPQGACVIFSRRFFERGGSLDYPMFLFYEEIFVAETARRLGLSILYCPRLRLVHEDHLSTGVFRSRATAAHVLKSLNYIIDAYFN